jgi:uncharacterized protein
MSATADPLTIDSREFTRRALQAEGKVAVSRLSRLASLLTRDDSMLSWRATGSRRRRADQGEDEILELAIEGEVWVPCVRCLAEVSLRIDLTSRFRLVASEVQAALEDSEDTDFEVLVSSSRFDLGVLIEDEAILCLPAIARHESCSIPYLANMESASGGGEERDGDPETQRPFAMLESLKKGQS